MTRDEAQTAYGEADAAFVAFHPTWLKAQDDYRAMRIGDTEFLAARKQYDALLAAFDVAYAAMQNFVDEEEVEVTVDDGQIDLFGA